MIRMKNRLILSLLFLIVIFLIGLPGCEAGTFQEIDTTIEDSDYLIRVIGTPQGIIPLPPEGFSYQGNYSVTSSEGHITSFSVSGTAPNEFAVRGIRTSGTFQKFDERGRLAIEISKDGKVIASSHTTNFYSVVHVATP